MTDDDMLPVFDTYVTPAAPEPKPHATKKPRKAPALLSTMTQLEWRIRQHPASERVVLLAFVNSQFPFSSLVAKDAP